MSTDLNIARREHEFVKMQKNRLTKFYFFGSPLSFLCAFIHADLAEKKSIFTAFHFCLHHSAKRAIII